MLGEGEEEKPWEVRKEDSYGTELKWIKSTSLNPAWCLGKQVHLIGQFKLDYKETLPKIKWKIFQLFYPKW